MKEYGKFLIYILTLALVVLYVYRICLYMTPQPEQPCTIEPKNEIWILPPDVTPKPLSTPVPEQSYPKKNQPRSF